MKKLIAASLAMLLAGCAHQRAAITSNFRSPRIERELNYYVANFSSHETNHFYVCATKLERGQLLKAIVYWKEERTLLDYGELEPDARHDIFAWGPHELKLDRDTVDTQEEVGTSDYLETHRTWVEWMEQCIRKGKPYCVLATDARRVFPAESGTSKTTGDSRISAMEIILKTSDAAAARYAKANKTQNGAAPADDALEHPNDFGK
jgi:hypothetical protein